jgi:hypothetical protein
VPVDRELPLVRTRCAHNSVPLAMDGSERALTDLKP